MLLKECFIPVILPDSYLTYSLPLGQGHAHDEDDEDARHIVELGGWLDVAGKHDWGDCRWRGEGELFYRE